MTATPPQRGDAERKRPRNYIEREIPSISSPRTVYRKKEIGNLPSSLDLLGFAIER
jgi:hypothetical protein